MKLNDFMRIVEIRTKIVSVSTLVLALAWSVYRGATIDVAVLAILTVSALAIDMGTTAFNTFFDYLHGVDRKDTNRESDKVLVHNNVPPAWALLIALGLYALGALAGLVLVYLEGWWLLPLGVLCMAIGFLYNGGPLPISRTPLGELFAGGALGGLFFCIAALILGSPFDQVTILAGLPSTLLIAAILTTNNNCDLQGDKKAGRLTLTILLGARAGLIVHHGLVFAAFIMALVLPLLTGPLRFASIIAMVPPLLGLVLSFPLLAAMRRQGFSHETKGPSMGAISQIFLLFTLVTLAEFLILGPLAGFFSGWTLG